MPVATVSIYCGGLLTLLMALFHTRFYRLFQWEGDRQRIIPSNKRILYTIHLALLLLFFGFAGLSFAYARELGAAKGVALGIDLTLALFWLWRAVWQLTYFRPAKKGRYMMLHWSLTAVFFLLIISYALPIILSAWQ